MAVLADGKLGVDSISTAAQKVLTSLRIIPNF
jgi:hypothetical protein